MAFLIGKLERRLEPLQQTSMAAKKAFAKITSLLKSDSAPWLAETVCCGLAEVFRSHISLSNSPVFLPEDGQAAESMLDEILKNLVNLAQSRKDTVKQKVCIRLF